MAAPPDEPCQLWTTPDEITACCPEEIPSTATPADLELAALFSSKTLWRFSDYRYPGSCPDEIFPCVGVNLARDGRLSLTPFANAVSIPFRDAGGVWRNLPIDCPDCFMSEVRLPGPVSDITEVEIDGAIVDPSVYAVRGFRNLVRVDGEFWPSAQRPPFRVAFVRGRPVPEDARRMASIFACRKLLPLICESQICDIDGEPAVITRDGVTIEFGNLVETFEKGRVGVPIVDLWLAALPITRSRGRRKKVVRADDPARGTRKFT